MGTSSDSDVLIIGAGHNGLVCAFYLARRGYKVTMLEARGVVGGAAVTEEFHPGFRNSTAAYTVSLLNPQVIRDMRLYDHGLEVVLRKIDNFLPTLGADYLLAGRGGLTRREIARHSPADAENYDAYSAALNSVVGILRQWLLRAPPNAGGGLADILALLKLGAGVNRLSLEEQRHLLDFFTKSAADILNRYFSHDLVQALFGFDSVVGHYASPYAPGTAYVLLHHVFGEAAGVEGAWGHAVGGMGAITQAMAKACREEGVEILLDTPIDEIIVEKGRAAGAVAGGKDLAGQGGRRRRQSPPAVRSPPSRGRGVRRNLAAHVGLGERIRHLPDERRSVRAAALHQPAGARRPYDRRHHHRAVARLYGPGLDERAQRGLLGRADRRDADPLDPRRQPRPGRPACRQPVLPAFPL